MNTDSIGNIGKDLAEIIRQSGQSQREIAERMGCSTQNLSRTLKTANPRFVSVAAIADGIGLYIRVEERKAKDVKASRSDEIIESLMNTQMSWTDAQTFLRGLGMNLTFDWR